MTIEGWYEINEPPIINFSLIDQTDTIEKNSNSEGKNKN
jgi:hypothetical protein